MRVSVFVGHTWSCHRQNCTTAQDGRSSGWDIGTLIANILVLNNPVHLLGFVPQAPYFLIPFSKSWSRQWGKVRG